MKAKMNASRKVSRMGRSDFFIWFVAYIYSKRQGFDSVMLVVFSYVHAYIYLPPGDYKMHLVCVHPLVCHTDFSKITAVTHFW